MTDYCVPHFAQFFKPGREGSEEQQPEMAFANLDRSCLWPCFPFLLFRICVETAVPRMRAREEEEEEAQKSLLERCEVRTKTSLVSNQS